jgi:hypothetical protein
MDAEEDKREVEGDSTHRDAPLDMPLDGPLVIFFAAIGAFVIAVLEFVWRLVLSAVWFVKGMFTQPSKTFPAAVRNTKLFFKRAAFNGSALYEEFSTNVPRPLRLLLALLSVAFVIVYVNSKAFRSQHAPESDAVRRMTLGGVDEYRRRIAAELDEIPPATATPAVTGSPSMLSWFRGKIWGTQAPAETRAPPPTPRWHYNTEAGKWEFAGGDDADATGPERDQGFATRDPSGGEGEGLRPDLDDGEGLDDWGGEGRQREDQQNQQPQEQDGVDRWGGFDDEQPRAQEKRRRRKRRVPLDDDDLEAAIDRTVRDDMEEADQLKRKIETIKERDKLGELRSTLGELYERRKLRQQIQNEYEWADEQEARRELVRERERAKWRDEDLGHRRRRRASGHFSDGAEDDGESDTPPKGLATGIYDDSKAVGFRRDGCQKPPVTVVPYGEFISSAVFQPDYAYVTYVSSAEYVQGAAVLMHSIALTGSQYSRAVMVTTEINERDRSLLSSIAQVIEVDRVQHPHYISNAHYRDTFTKLRIWELAMFRKVVYIDVDVVIVRNIDDLFDLNEWYVPMDAEQSRYSTGMMVCEPSLTTFDDMMEKLQSTHVSMELPDLLFLKEYFDNKNKLEAANPPPPQYGYYGMPPPPPPKRINIIPRWYQVYQEEFGSEYKTYLTARKQRITIYDRRIHGIHYPGNGKPWHNFGTYWAKYKDHLCRWADAEQFIYEPRFMWYVHYAWMKSTLKAATGSVAFDFEAGGGQIKLSDWVTAQKSTPAPPVYGSYNNYRSYGYNNNPQPQYGTNNGNGQPQANSYNSYNSRYGQSNYGTPQPPAALSTPAPTTAAPVPNSPETWLAESCKVRRSISLLSDGGSGSTSDEGADELGSSSDGAEAVRKVAAKRSLLQVFQGLEEGGEPQQADDAGNDAVADNDDSAQDTAGYDEVQDLRDSEPELDKDGDDGGSSGGSASSSGDGGSVVVVDLTTLDPLAVLLPQSWSGVDLEPYKWIVTWCTAKKLHAKSDSACGMDSYVAQYSGGLCRTNFAEDLSLHTIFTQTAEGSDEIAGVVLRSSVKLTYPPRRKVIEVVVRCDPSMESESEAALDTHPNASRVVVDSVRPPHDRRYTLRLRSRCACAGGCGEAKASLQTTASSAPTTKKSSGPVMTPAVLAWAKDTFSDPNSPFPAGSVFGKCLGASVSACLEEAGCDYVISQSQCTPSVGTEWILVSGAVSGKFSDCSHAGGNAIEPVTSEQCFVKASAAGANVVNYVEWPPEQRGKSQLPPPPPGQTITGGCYFKTCPLGTLYRGLPSLKKAAAADERGFDVYFRNPYYMSDTDAAEFEGSG